jgi:hypothetical protein
MISRENPAIFPVWQNPPKCNNFQLPFFLSCFPFRGMEQQSESLLLFLFHGTEFWLVFSSSEGFLEWNSQSCFYFYSTERNSKLFSLLQKDSELNSESFLFCFLFVFSDTSSRFWLHVCAHALCAPFFLGQWTRQTERCVPPAHRSFAAPPKNKLFPETKCFPSGLNSSRQGRTIFHWAKLHLTELHCTLLSYASPFWATLCPKSYTAPSELSCNLLSSAVPFWATLHPSELRCTLLSYTSH